MPEKKTEKLQPEQTNVFFKINSAVIRPEETGKVDELAAYLQKHPAAKVTLTGYADVQTGNPRINKTLSAKRAQAVADALTEKGIAADRITVDSKGDTVQPYATPEKKPGYRLYHIRASDCTGIKAGTYIPDYTKSFHKKGAIRSGKCPF